MRLFGGATPLASRCHRRLEGLPPPTLNRATRLQTVVPTSPTTGRTLQSCCDPDTTDLQEFTVLCGGSSATVGGATPLASRCHRRASWPAGNRRRLAAELILLLIPCRGSPRSPDTASRASGVPSSRLGAGGAPSSRMGGRRGSDAAAVGTTAGRHARRLGGSPHSWRRARARGWPTRQSLSLALPSKSDPTAGSVPPRCARLRYALGGSDSLSGLTTRPGRRTTRSRDAQLEFVAACSALPVRGRPAHAPTRTYPDS